jgi:RNA polymerase sigma-70 factor (ECF subfamily)
MAVWDNIDTFCPEKNSFKNWVAAIAKYKSIDYKRRYLKLLEQENIEGLNLASSWSGEKAIMEKVIPRVNSNSISGYYPGKDDSG